MDNSKSNNISIDPKDDWYLTLKVIMKRIKNLAKIFTAELKAANAAITYVKQKNIEKALIRR